MLPRHQNFNLISRLRTGLSTHKSLCTITNSPNLPASLKTYDTQNPSATSWLDQDIVFPSLASWVEAHKLGGDSSKVVRHSLGEKPDADVDKIDKILEQRYPTPDYVVQALNECGVNGLSDLVSQVLKRFSNDWIPAFGVFIWAKSQTGYRHPPELCNAMVDILGKSKEFKLMWELVEEMNRASEYVTLDTMTKIMRRLAKAGQYDDAIDVFRSIQRFGVSRDTMAMNALMDLLVKEKSVEHARKVLVEFKDCIPCNSHTYNVLIFGYCICRKSEEAQKIMDEMKKDGHYPDVISYTSLIEAYCWEKDFCKVDAVLEEMQEKGCNPNATTYSIIVRALGKARKIGEALEVYEKMKGNSCLPNTSFYSSFILVLSKAGRFEDATKIFDDMAKQGVGLDVLTYKTMISSACVHQKEKLALKLLWRMKEDSLKPDIRTYTPLLKMFCKKKRMKLLSFLLEHMLKNDTKIDLGIYSILVQGLCKSGKLKEACFYFEEMVSKGIVPKNFIHRMLLKKLEENGMAEDQERIEKLSASILNMS
ncbi:pentatricopeptide repeat-containing protein At3g22670, mitochondrial-like [Carica papaya]|uniref:pentatricopeptide repeat-containing protein At3g22670, mitochondrial-like n=1 Tax=Carica papaya TaxID=3649 RepID=UPI000B8D1049|nr:pentatricopeptide repeat-containing protein At3g22670, mitochondrial-like [Carica papaya]